MIFSPVFQIVPDLLKTKETVFVVFITVHSISLYEKTSKQGGKMFKKFRKSALAVALTIVFTSVGCVCPSGNPFGIGACNPCGPCGSSFDCCSPCGMSACQPAACEMAECGACFAAEACEPAACEVATCGPCACSPSACEPCACSPSACEPCGCSPAACDPCGCSCGLGMRTGFGFGFGNPNGLFSAFGNHRNVKQNRGVFGRPSPDEMYVTRGPRDYFYNPQTMR